jgi:hypothetical protein
MKDSDEPLWDTCVTHSKLSIIAQVFNIKLNYRSSEVSYDRILKWWTNLLPKGNRLKNNFYVVKYMMKPLGLGYQKINSYDEVDGVMMHFFIGKT